MKSRTPKILADCGDGECRWPVGRRGHRFGAMDQQLFCCEPVKPVPRGEPKIHYCAGHYAAAYPKGSR